MCRRPWPSVTWIRVLPACLLLAFAGCTAPSDNHQAEAPGATTITATATVTETVTVTQTVTQPAEPETQDPEPSPRESAAASLSSPSTGVIEITLVREGSSAPYTTAEGASYYRVTVAGQTCTPADDALPETISAGSVIRLTARTGEGGGCSTAFSPGDAHVSVTLTTAGTTILDTTVTVKG